MIEVNKEDINPDLIFETSWEVCNKIGGIYAVLSTKAKTLQKLFKDKTIFIGPDVWTSEQPSPYFIESDDVLKTWREKANLPYGVTVRTGRWNVPGQPIAVLVKFDTMYAIKDELYGKMWELYGVDSLHAYGDYDEACAFSHAAAIVIKSICDYKRIGSKHVVAHFDEWTTAMGLLLTKWQLPNVATVFTTHATSIGRSICGNNKPLYDYLQGYDGDQMARELNMESKHSLEKAAAHAADCFTTVSDVTARECEQLLGIRPHVTPNGFEKNFVPEGDGFNAHREEARKAFLGVAEALTGKKWGDDTFIVVTSGRCEYRNKGIDVYLDSLDQLRRQTSSHVLAMVLVPAWVDKPRSDLQLSLTNGKATGLFDPVITHTLHNAPYDPILCRMRGLGFNNHPLDSMSVIYVPCYLDGFDGIFGKTYYDLLIGADASVFPSYYEPWGYTPLESVAFGVPTVTTSLSGFGQWVLGEDRNGFELSGVEVINRNDSNYGQVVNDITSSLQHLMMLTPEQREEVAHAAMDTADRASWSNFIHYYKEAFEIALANAASRNRKAKPASGRTKKKTTAKTV